MADQIPESVYLDAALVQQVAWRPGEDPEWQQRIAERMAADPPFRAAVESAYRAGYGQGRDDEAAGLGHADLSPLPRIPGEANGG